MEETCWLGWCYWIEALQRLRVEHALPFIVLFPLAGALFNALVGRKESKRLVAQVAIGSVAVAFGLAMVCFYELWNMRSLVGDRSVSLSADLYEWFTVAIGSGGSAPVRIRFTMDALSGVMTLVITGIGLLIHIFSMGYMSEEPSYARFFCYLNLFTASMLILVLGSNLPLMFVGWEGVGLCSYLLIGFWWQTPEYAAAGRKAFIYNRVGDFGVLMGMFLLVAAVGSFEFSDINQAATVLGGSIVHLDAKPLGVSVATLACLFLFLGCTGKSAQLPLYVWLPDAMAGPTPVSALIHAATMVTAGVYLMCRLSPVFVQAPYAMAVIAIVGTLTAVLGASIALVQNQIKKVLAYSTVSQLGFMVAAAGVGAFSAAFFHVFTHAFFKACLFLGAGSVMHAVSAHGDADIRELGGLRKYLPQTHWTFLVSCLAIAGVPLFSGFFSKDEILLGAANAGEYFYFAPWLGQAVFGALLLTASMTAFYMFRLYFMTFAGSYRGGGAHHAHGADDAHAEHHGRDPHESPASMTVPLIVLALGALSAGYLGLPHAFHLPNLWGDWLAPVLATLPAALAEHEHATSIAIVVMILGTSAALLGIVCAWWVYRMRDGQPAATLARAFPKLHQLLMDKWRVDELYQAIIIGPAHALAEFFGIIDKVFVDLVLTRLPAVLAQAFGFFVTRIQNGMLHTYTVAFAVGVTGVVAWFAFPHPVIESEVHEQEVTYRPQAGIGYWYRWDLNHDGNYDTEWRYGPEPVTHTYTAQAINGVVLEIQRIRPRPVRSEVHLRRHERHIFSEELLGPDWQREDGQDVLPAVFFRNGQWRLRPNGARVRKAGRIAKEELVLEMGDRLLVGSSVVTVSGLGRAKLQVRNVFGNMAITSAEVVINFTTLRKEKDGALQAMLKVSP